MLALALSPLNKNHRQLIADMFYTDEQGYVDMTPFGESICTMPVRYVLEMLMPWHDMHSMTEAENDLLNWHLFNIPLPAPPPPEQLTLF